jgi:short-subunit dehydrogenase
MNIKEARVLLTGANGGIGAALAERLVADGASVALFGRRPAAVDALARRLGEAHPAAQVHGYAVDLLDNAARAKQVDRAIADIGGIDLLINCAGQAGFGPYAEVDPARLETMLRLNLVVPSLLIRQVLPTMMDSGTGRIVNVGSTFGSIGFACFAGYSASKFGLRGLSEALRRELDGSGVGVTYVAPRAVRTAFNSDAVNRMAEATGMTMDEPDRVARRIVRAIERDARDVYLGFPESFFARLNALLPRLVDNGLRKQNRAMVPFSREAS